MVCVIERGSAVLAVGLVGGEFVGGRGGLELAREIVQVGEGGAEYLVGGAREGA